MPDPLLDPIEHALCCPNGRCRALEAGRLADCGAKMTEEHAEAAIRIFRRAQARRIKALLSIRDEATKLADSADTNGIELAFRALARVASDGLQETGE